MPKSKKTNGQVLDPAQEFVRLYKEIGRQKNHSDEDIDRLRKLVVSTPATWPLATDTMPAIRHHLIEKISHGVTRAFMLSYMSKAMSGRRVIQAFICSHRDADHVRGIKKLHKAFPLVGIWDNGVEGTTTDSPEYCDYMDLRRQLTGDDGASAICTMLAVDENWLRASLDDREHFRNLFVCRPANSTHWYVWYK